MKLSMWMIANQISELDIKTEIREDAPAILNSARLAYATNCVHIYKEKDYVVCSGEGDKIYIYDMTVTRVLELIQAIFDSHEDWISSIKDSLSKQDYQAAIDQAYKLFKNPMILFDANNKVLGQTSAYGEHDLDSEWAYLHKYGYSSVNAINMLKYYSGNNEFYSENKISYDLPQNNLINLSGVTYSIFFNTHICGRINLIAKERQLNQGDMQLLHELIDVLEPSLGQILANDLISDPSNVFLTLLRGKTYNRRDLELQLKYMNWKEDDEFYVTVVRLHTQTDLETLKRHLNSLFRMLIQNLTDTSINVWKNELIILSTRNLTEEYDSRTLLRNLVMHNPVRIGFSLPDKSGIYQISKFYHQAEYTLKRSDHEEKPKAFQNFEKYAIEYLLLAEVAPTEKMMACMPAMLELWKEKQKGDDMFHTLLCFLNNERSIAQTSAELYLHRNTTVYRIKKIQEKLEIDLNDSTVRNYCHISLHFLNNLENLDIHSI